MIKIIQSVKSGKKWFESTEPVSFEADEKGEEMNLLMVYRNIRHQTIKGFGGALTQASGYTYFKMSDVVKKEFLKACFSKDGLNYSLGRTHIGSCDFSFGNYSYCDKPGETGLESFSIACDSSYLLPFIKDICDYRGEPLPLLASPWSPPAWMKSNGEMLHGGYLLPEYYGVWADYVVKYIKAYREQGFEVRYITVQNEPKAVQIWESCVYSAQQEKVLVRDYLYPALQNAGLGDVGILIWDHNKERVFTRSSEIFEDEKVRDMVSGIAFHWYSGDHFENVGLCREFYPEKDLFFTEGCVELASKTTVMAQKALEGSTEEISAENSPWEFGECYAHDMIGNFNHGMNGFLEWNVLLDEKGGPNHVGNYCGAPIIYDTVKEKMILQPSYFFIGHFSKFIPTGSQCIAHSCYTSKLETASFLTPAEDCVVVVMNPQTKPVPYSLKDTVSGKITSLVAPAKSISTVVYKLM